MAIVCGTDLSELSLDGLTAALAIGQRRGDPDLVLIHVLDTSQLDTDDEAATEALATAARQRLELDAARLAAGASLRVRSHVVIGPTVPSLIASTEVEGGSLLVIAATSHASSDQHKLGSMARQLAEAARVPLLIVRSAAGFVDWAAGTRPLRVMIGLDESASCEPAIAQLKLLRQAGPVDVVVAHIYYADEAARRYGLRNHSMVDADPELERLLIRDLERRLGALPGEGTLRFQPRIGLGRIGDHLLEVADASNTDLLLIGTRQKGGIGRLSSVASVVLHDAKQSVWCVPAAVHLGRSEVPRFRVAVVATDLSDLGNHAVPYGYTLVGENGGEVHLVHVRDKDRDGSDPRAVEAELLAQVPPNQSGVVTRVHVLSGDDPARVIGEAAERLGADVVVVASRGRAGITRALLGSVADKLLRTCRRPVLVLRPPSE